MTCAALPIAWALPSSNTSLRVLDWFKDKDTLVFCDFVSRWPTLRRQRAKGASHQAALRALAFKWIRILYRCWQTRTPYDETTYLNALKRRGSPLLA
jgi:hypothetical protein